MSTVIIGDKEVQSVKWRDEYVMTTETLAYFFEVPKANIKKNFVRNLDRFIESKHYFKVEGRELRDLVTNCPQVLSKNTPMLYLWTRRGVARHAKMINSDVAWDVFELLEDAYFNRDTENPTDNSTLPGADFWWEVKQPHMPTDFERGVQLKKLASHTRNPELREQLILEAANLIAGKKIYSEKRFF